MRLALLMVVACGSNGAALPDGQTSADAHPDATNIADAGATDAPIDVPIDASIDAPIDAPLTPHEVSIVKGGNGSGRVTSNPAGIDCGTTCTATFTGDVTLIATPDAGSMFVGWTELCGNEPSCVVPASADPSVVHPIFALGNLTIDFAGDAPGEVYVYAENEPVQRCSSTCTLHVPPSRITAVAVTPYDFVRFDGPNCYADDCIFEVGTGTQLTATFARNPHDRWLFLGDPGELFSVGAFDHAGNLVASSDSRLMKLDTAGQLLWSREPVTRVVIGAGDVIYIDDLLGTVQLGPDGLPRWSHAGVPIAVDPAGNVVVVESATMTKLAPDGSEIWTVPGNIDGIDGTGLMYKLFVETTVQDPDDPYSYDDVVLRAHRYLPDGSPTSDSPARWDYSTSNPGMTTFAVAPSHLGVGYELDDDFGTYYIARESAKTLTGVNAGDAETWSEAYPMLHMRFALAAAGDDLGFINTPYGSDFNSRWGFTLGRLVANTRITRKRYPELRTDGHYFGGLAGSFDGSVAMLGRYRPIDRDNPGDPPAVGAIQAFSP